jgi:hypothetical protein
MPVELVGIKPAFPPGVVSRNAGESGAGAGLGWAGLVVVRSVPDC